jgi:hypothetical protein
MVSSTARRMHNVFVGYTYAMLTQHRLLTCVSCMLIVIYFSCKTSRSPGASAMHGQAAGNQYYDDHTAKYLGKDKADTISYRLISATTFHRVITTDTGKNTARLLQDSSRLITIDEGQIQSDLQWARDHSLDAMVEYQIYIYINLITNVVSSVRGEPGDNRFSYPEIKSAPEKGVIYTVVNHNPIINWILIGQAHGHPTPNQPGRQTARLMSPSDSTVAVCAQIPIYGIDAMDGGIGTRGDIHRANPGSTQDSAIGKTWGRQGFKTKRLFNLGLDALQRWGRAQTPDFKCIDSLSKRNKADSPQLDKEHPIRPPIP